MASGRSRCLPCLPLLSMTAALAHAAADPGGSVPYDAKTHTPVKSTGCGKKPTYPRGKTVAVQGTFSDGYKNTWLVYLPSHYDENTPIPLIVHHHGWGMSMTAEEAGAGITALADQKNFISITPQGPGDNTHNGGPWYSWNAVGTTQSPGPAGPTCTEKANHPGFCYTSCETSEVEGG